MSTIVYQSLVSCFESQVTETTILKMKVVPAPTTVDMGRGSCIAGSDQNAKENLEIGTWSSLQSLSKISTCPKEAMEMENSYVHRKPSFTRLTGKSLELCTENLGSETGTDNITDSNSIFSLDTNNSRSKNSSPMDQQQQRAHQQVKSSRNNKMTTSCRSFPPPLTTMKGSSSLQVRPHRENGRLIIKAVEVPSRHSYLQAERSHGRLRLSFFQDYDSNFDSELGYSQLDDEIKSDSNDGDHELENEEMSEAMDVEMGIEKFQRLSRCKEGGHGSKGLCNWKPAFWVATS